MSFPEQLPRGWRRATIGELVSEHGEFCDGDWVETVDQDPNGDVRLIQLADVGDGIYKNKSHRFMTTAKAQKLSCTYLKPGDVMIARMPDPLGRACIFPGDDKPSVTVVDVCIVRTGSEAVDHRWLQWFINSPKFRTAIAALQSGSTRKRISRGNLGTLELPVPPSNEQRRIVAKIEELFSDLDAGVAALERVRANLKRYRAAVLHAAVTGKLTKEWRLQHPQADTAELLLTQIQQERQRTWNQDRLKKYTSSEKAPPKGWQEKYEHVALLGGNGFEVLPAGWCWASVDQLGHVQLGRQRSPKNRSQDYPTKYIRAANITEAGLALSDVLEMEFQPHELENYRLRSGDIILSEASGSPDQVGKPAVWADEIPDCCFQNTVIRLRPSIMNSAYLLKFFEHCYVNKVFAKIAAGVGINHLSAAKFSKMRVPVMPLDEQAAIVETVERRLSVVEAVEADVNHGLQRAARLRQAILKRAFEGKLVPQNDDDMQQPIAVESVPLATLRRRGRVSRISQPPRIKRKHRKGIAFDRCAVMSYVVNRLSSSRNFGRTEAMKTLYLGEAWLGIDLELEPIREQMGPLDNAIYKIENLGRKQAWFTTRRAGPMIRYEAGPNIAERLVAGRRIIGNKLTEFDRLLAAIAKMDTDSAELFATTFAVWNDLLMDKLGADDGSIIAGIHEWHLTKIEKFPADRIVRCINWMKQQCFIPTGNGPRSLVPVA